MRTSWAFHDDYCDEMYVAFPESLESSLTGVKVDRWMADVAHAAADAEAANDRPPPVT
jgi:hypothetical protein